MTEQAAALPASAKTASHAAIRSAITETEAALSKVSLSSDSKADESLEEGEIPEDAAGEAQAEAQDAEDATDVDPNRQITVFSDHQKFNVVHPLYNGWSVLPHSLQLTALMREAFA